MFDREKRSGGLDKEINVVDTERNDVSDAERNADPATYNTVGDESAHILDVNQLHLHPGEGDVKLALDGHTVLIPQPSSDSNDPLNWSEMKKGIILSVISIVAFLPDFGSSMGIITLLPQAM